MSDRGEMSRTATRLVAYTAVLALVLGGGYALGSRFPDETPPTPSEHDGDHSSDHSSDGGHVGNGGHTGQSGAEAGRD